MHMQRKWSSGVLFSLLFTLLLTACSSGGGDSATPVVPAGTAEGQWTGTITTPTGQRTVMGAVLDDGTYWFLYSAVGTPAVMEGMLQGNGSAQNGTFDSLNGLDFSNTQFFEDIFPVTVSANYVMGNSLSGEVRYPGATPFTSTFDPEYNKVPDITKVDGFYDGFVFGFAHTITVTLSPPIPPSTVPSSAAITVTTTGGPHRTGVSTVTGIELGCDFTGTLSPRSQGNVYDITLTPDPSNSATVAQCSPDTLTGVAVFDAASINKKIYVLALHRDDITPDLSRAFPFTGTRP